MAPKHEKIVTQVELIRSRHAEVSEARAQLSKQPAATELARRSSLLGNLTLDSQRAF